MAFKKGNVPWNKDKKGLQVAWNKDIPRTQVVKDAISRANKGKRCGKDNPNFGKHPIPWNKDKPWSDEIKDKIRKTLTGKLMGEKNPNYGNRGSENPIWGKPHTEERDRKISESKLGDKNPAWIDGRSYLRAYKHPYPFDFNEELKELIRKRDNYVCQICGCPQVENVKKFSIHHIDDNKDNCNPKNLVSLCRSCHGRVGHNRERWQLIFEEKIL